MDSLAGLLDAPRARGAFALRVVMSSPWSLRILAESPVTLIAGVAGETWIVPDDGKPVPIGPGAIAVTRAPAHYNVADAPTTRRPMDKTGVVPQVLIPKDEPDPIRFAIDHLKRASSRPTSGS